mmetsp:Transcript_40927/g.96328  ORF Transcript_40927/g.96328 Transcript_40927/m.96328 type:complete len:606 (+) Transcript_40927:186-2003(+)
MHCFRLGRSETPFWFGASMREINAVEIETFWLYFDEKEASTGSHSGASKKTRSNLGWFTERLKKVTDNAARGLPPPPSAAAVLAASLASAASVAAGGTLAETIAAKAPAEKVAERPAAGSGPGYVREAVTGDRRPNQKFFPAHRRDASCTSTFLPSTLPNFRIFSRESTAAGSETSAPGDTVSEVPSGEEEGEASLISGEAVAHSPKNFSRTVKTAQISQRSASDVNPFSTCSISISAICDSPATKAPPSAPQPGSAAPSRSPGSGSRSGSGLGLGSGSPQLPPPGLGSGPGSALGSGLGSSEPAPPAPLPERTRLPTLPSPVEMLRRLGERQKVAVLNAIHSRLVGGSDGGGGRWPVFGAFLRVRVCEIKKIHLQHGDATFKLDVWRMGASYMGDNTSFARVVLVGMVEKAMAHAVSAATEAAAEKLHDTAAGAYERIQSNVAMVGRVVGGFKALPVRLATGTSATAAAAAATASAALTTDKRAATAAATTASAPAEKLEKREKLEKLEKATPFANSETAEKPAARKGTGYILGAAVDGLNSLTRRRNPTPASVTASAAATGTEPKAAALSVVRMSSAAAAYTQPRTIADEANNSEGLVNLELN